MLGRPFMRPFALALLWALRLSDRRAGVALVYHAVEERAGDPERELVPAMASSLFEHQVRYLERHYRVVKAGDLLRAVAQRRRGERFPVALTFDDDLRCHVDVTLPILRRAGVPGTFFLTGASLERPRSFWWERLARAPRERLPDLVATVPGHEPEPRPSLHELGALMKQLDAAARAEVEARLVDVAGPDPADAGLRAADVRLLVDAGMEIGFHTLQHHNLLVLSDASLGEAMDEGRAFLEDVVGSPLEAICYPYGYADRRVADAARAAGFVTGFTAESAAVTADGDPLLCGRVGPSFRSAGRLATQLPLALLSARSEGSSTD